MMRAALGALTVAGVIVAAPSAFAAQGSIVVNGSVHHEPSGCFETSAGPAYLALENHTDAIMTVYSRPGCRGDIIAVLVPSQIVTTTGASLFLP